jgi:hypothetical protein
MGVVLITFDQYVGPMTNKTALTDSWDNSICACMEPCYRPILA